ncbi:hypothetical protein AgCh_033255 [Apium graveolens]
MTYKTPISEGSNAEDVSLSVKNSDNLTQDQYNHLLNLINQKNGGPRTTDHDDNDKRGLLTVKFCLFSRLNGHLIIDSGFTDHICPSIDQFTTYRVVMDTENTISIPDGKKIRVFHIGTVKLNDNIILKDCFIQGHFLKGPQIQLGSLSNGLYIVPYTAPFLAVKRCNAAISKNLE